MLLYCVSVVHRLIWPPRLRSHRRLCLATAVLLFLLPLLQGRAGATDAAIQDTTPSHRRLASPGRPNGGPTVVPSTVPRLKVTQQNQQKLFCPIVKGGKAYPPPAIAAAFGVDDVTGDVAKLAKAARVSAKQAALDLVTLYLSLPAPNCSTLRTDADDPANFLPLNEGTGRSGAGATFSSMSAGKATASNVYQGTCRGLPQVPKPPKSPCAQECRNGCGDDAACKNRCAVAFGKCVSACCKACLGTATVPCKGPCCSDWCPVVQCRPLCQKTKLENGGVCTGPLCR